MEEILLLLFLGVFSFVSSSSLSPACVPKSFDECLIHCRKGSNKQGGSYRAEEKRFVIRSGFVKRKEILLLFLNVKLQASHRSPAHAPI